MYADLLLLPPRERRAYIPDLWISVFRLTRQDAGWLAAVGHATGLTVNLLGAPQIAPPVHAVRLTNPWVTRLRKLPRAMLDTYQQVRAGGLGPVIALRSVASMLRQVAERPTFQPHVESDAERLIRRAFADY